MKENLTREHYAALEEHLFFRIKEQKVNDMIKVIFYQT